MHTQRTTIENPFQSAKIDNFQKLKKELSFEGKQISCLKDFKSLII